MRIFDYKKLSERTWDKEILNYIGLIHEYKGRQQLYLEQKPEELDRLIAAEKVDYDKLTEKYNTNDIHLMSNRQLKNAIDNIDKFEKKVN